MKLYLRSISNKFTYVIVWGNSRVDNLAGGYGKEAVLIAQETFVQVTKAFFSKPLYAKVHQRCINAWKK